MRHLDIFGDFCNKKGSFFCVLNKFVHLITIESQTIETLILIKREMVSFAKVQFANFAEERSGWRLRGVTLFFV